MIRWSDDAQAELTALCEDYAKTLPEKIARLSELWLVFSNLENDESRLELLSHLHTLAGSAPSFGLSCVGEAARCLEGLVKDFDSNADLMTDEARAKIGSQVEVLRQSVSPGVWPLIHPSFASRSQESSKRVF